MGKMIKVAKYEEVPACDRCGTKAQAATVRFFENALGDGVDITKAPLKKADLCHGCIAVICSAFTIRRHKKADKKIESAT